MFRRSLLFALLIPAVYGCDREEACDVAASVEPSLRVGTGEEVFRALHDGDHVDVTYGAQGGRHIWVGARTEGVDPGRDALLGAGEPAPELRFSLWSADEVQLGEGWTQQPLDGDPLSAEITGQELYVDWWSESVTTEGGPDLTALFIRAELEDRCGVQVSDEVVVTAEL